jgi:hypothetical protein
MPSDTKNTTEPPTYDASQAAVASTSYHTTIKPSPSSQRPISAGPTPINSYYPVGAVVGPSANGETSATVAFLPYYDTRSPYLHAQAISRAKRRFFGALLWAVAIYVLVGMAAGGIVEDVRWWRRHRHAV